LKGRMKGAVLNITSIYPEFDQKRLTNEKEKNQNKPSDCPPEDRKRKKTERSTQ